MLRLHVGIATMVMPVNGDVYYMHQYIYALEIKVIQVTQIMINIKMTS